MESPEEQDQDLPKKLGPYEIREWLGVGGMGEVCRAYDTRLDREVAIKRILTKKTSHSTVQERFRREARAVARLNHPSIVQIYDLMDIESTDWIVMEFVEGETLLRRLKRGPLDAAVALQLMRDVAEGLAEAHENDIIHRDIKAENVMITPRGRAKILDFGLVRPFAEQDVDLTMEGTVVGTPHAMSPEQSSGGKVDARSDLFSFGSLFFYALTGRHPFRATKIMETLRRVQTRRQPPAHWLRPEVPEVISELIDELLEKDPAERPASTSALARRLGQLASTPFSDLANASSPPPTSAPDKAVEPPPAPTRLENDFLGAGGTTQITLVSGEAAAEITAFRDLGEENTIADEEGRDSPLVGRDEELTLIVQRWQLVREGTGQVVLLSGAAGIGKSRLVASFLGHEATTDAVPLVVQCHRHEQGVPFAPAVRLLRHLVRPGGTEGDFDQSQLESFLTAYGQPLQEVVPLFAKLISVPITSTYATLSLSPEGLRKKTLEALLALLVEMSAHNPLALVLEDIHWMDPSTLELLDHLVRQGPTAALLTLLTTRSSALGRWSSAPHLSVLTLGPLDHRQTEELIHNLTGGRKLPKAVEAELVEKSDGIPLFAEELARGLFESETMTGHEGDSSIGALASRVRIPATLEDSLKERLDRLGPTKAIAQDASAIGRSFSERLLQAVSPLSRKELTRHLDRLVQAEIIYRRGVGEQASFVFKHALLQDSAYQSLSRSKRRQLHGQIISALRAAFPKQVAERPELLAHHQMAAGKAREAVELWLKAGRQACERSANVEAIHHLRRGLEAVVQLADDATRQRLELALYIQLGPVLIATRGYSSDEVEEAYTQIQELCDPLGSSTENLQALWGIYAFHVGRAELERAQHDAEGIMELARQQGDATLLAEAHHALGGCHLFLGSLKESHEHMTLASESQPKGPSNYGATGHDPWVNNSVKLAVLAWIQGRHAESLERLDEGLERARRLEHVYSEGFAVYFAAWVHQLRGEPEETERLARQLLHLAREQGFLGLLGKGEFFLGWAQAAASPGGEDPYNELTLVRSSVEGAETLGVRLLQTHSLAVYGELCLSRGLLSDAADALAKASKICHDTGERFWEAEILRLGGELQLARGNFQGAQAAFEQALGTARRQQARSLELTAAVSLSRFFAARGQQQTARDILAASYAPLAQEMETPGVRAARLQLTELS